MLDRNKLTGRDYHDVQSAVNAGPAASAAGRTPRCGFCQARSQAQHRLSPRRRPWSGDISANGGSIPAPRIDRLFAQGNPDTPSALSSLPSSLSPSFPPGKRICPATPLLRIWKTRKIFPRFSPGNSPIPTNALRARRANRATPSLIYRRRYVRWPRQSPSVFICAPSVAPSSAFVIGHCVIDWRFDLPHSSLPEW